MTRATTRAVCALFWLCAAASCSSPGGGGPTQVGCGEDVRVGQFALELKPALNGAPPYSQVTGAVRDGVDPKDVWQEIAHEGDCQVMIGPALTCAPACGVGMVCAGSACVPAPVGHPVGTVTMTGLLVPLTITPNATNASYYGAIPTGTAFPPYEVGATLGLASEGGDYPPLSLEANGIEPLALVDGQTLPVKTTGPNDPLLVRWNAAQAGGAGRVRLSFDIAHHAGIAAELRCEVPDTGMARVPAGLLDALVSRGTAGFPELVVTRVSASTATIPPGCLEFAVGSAVPVQLSVEAVTSCTQDSECTVPQICLPELKCG